MLKKFCFILTLVPTLLFAQQKECVKIDWSKHFGGSKLDAANDIQRTSDGGFIVVGYSRSQDEDLVINHGLSDFWIVKLDAQGNLQWQQAYGGADNDIANAVHQTPDGGYMVAGGAVSFDGQVIGNHGAEDAWVMKLDAIGNIIWKKTYGGSLNDRAESMQPTSDGGYILSGYSQSSDGDVSANFGEFDYWVFKINANGNLLWEKNLGGSLSDFAFDAIQTTDGGYLVAGSTFSDDGQVTNNQGFYDYWLTKLDAAGNLVWEQGLGGLGEERAYSVALAPSGVVVCGTSNSNAGDLPGNNGSYDYWVMKISLSGSLVWSKNLGGSSEDRAVALAPKIDGGVLVTGFSASSNQDVGGNYGSRDAWLVNLDSDGEIIWEKNLGGSMDDRFFAVLETAEGQYACAGYSTSSNQDLDGNYGEPDMWVVSLKLDSSAVDLGTDTILCAGQGIILDATMPNATYLWPDGSTLPVFLVSAPGDYWVELDIEGCKIRDTIQIEYVSETPVNIGNDTTLCEGETLELDPGIPGADVLWKNGSIEPTLTVELPGNYWVEVKKDGCEYRDSILVDFTTIPIELGEDVAICEGETELIDASFNDATYLWNDGSTGPNYTVSSPGLVWVLVTKDGCSRTDSVQVYVQQGPVDPLPDFGFICEGEGVWFNVKFDGATYLWQDGSTEHNFKAVAPGNYGVQVDVNGCIFEDEVELLSCERCLYVPNVFSPNGDGFNDEFRSFPGCEISNYHQFVFNRWGNLVFESKSPDIAWDGYIKGEKAQNGSFAYRIEFDYQNGSEVEHQIRVGAVALLR